MSGELSDLSPHPPEDWEIHAVESLTSYFIDDKVDILEGEFCCSPSAGIAPLLVRPSSSWIARPS
jgi:hypothetical protein